jgi:hypothetical protein
MMANAAATTCFCSRHANAVDNFGRVVGMEGYIDPGTNQYEVVTHCPV